jgi:PadR family transcriptional regulator, regulatory protein PadR
MGQPGKLRRTRALTQVAIAMLEDPTGRHYGYELAGQASVRAGTLYPILARLLERGWVTDGWEDEADAHADGRPPRRYYILTGEGEAALSAIRAEALAEVAAKRSIIDMLRPETGR